MFRDAQTTQPLIDRSIRTSRTANTRVGKCRWAIRIHAPPRRGQLENANAYDDDNDAAER
jgi:hypothetical protein